MKEGRYIVGIDLGTTNCVVAYSDMQAERAPREMAKINLFRVPQLTGPGVVELRDSLPSFLYVKEGHEDASNSLELPWQQEDTVTVAGEFARERGADVPHKLISSAKSWLCNAAVDRETPILPWNTTKDIEKLSPVQASCALLRHIKNAWNHEMAADDPDLCLENQAIYLTVPASFDAVARELTVKSAKMAGLKDIVLIEEPQSAFYAWIDKAGDDWRDQVEKGDLVLVCDIGGGTSDFSLIEVNEGADGLLNLERVAVGNHLLVGGDNLDLTLSYFLAAKLREKKQKLDDWQMRGLVHACRKAKENLFSSEGPDEYPVTVLGRGSSLIKGTIKLSLKLADVQQVVLDGFFPACSLDDKPAGSSTTGMKEFGLSYESDPAITRHLAQFISSHTDDQGNPRLPTAVVFNGGVMKSPLIRERVLDVLKQWHSAAGSGEIRQINAVDFDLSVAWGASYYGQAARGEGIKIRGGLGMSYYMAIEAAMPAIPGLAMPTRALCIAPFGMEEGSQAESKDRLFNLVVGEKVTFDIMSSPNRPDDQLGDVIDNWEDMGIISLTSIETELEGTDEGFIPVTFEVKVTEIGTLEFWACARDDDRKWRLELNVRPKV
ncbi:Hsp70 family protein [Desulfobacter hydrogenophilus]|uniref:Hsp70 family protein n=1 Tax=Desulfobacter hydrogenophilus TaxID=2291 RepID=A0A328FCJ4_9BACT|nr:Hsp70 family protein [Desulfobacter hydrogenophilus]NDY72680.1 Hsp70 family protein [Desulfobacter hydrogenophilus]QBH14502.1 Hsp70 family protein [Desulfobacter hydrogenophilus]RAM01440.1 Hsp70 family protein [Desulfobacter hydrogenophilus]